MEYLVKDNAFEKIWNFLRSVKSIHKKDKDRLRIFIEAIAYMSRAGCQWRLLPRYYGHWRAVHKRFWQWSKRGIWAQLFEAMKEDPDMEWVLLDSTIVRAHACSAGYGEDQALGRSRGGFSTKIHFLVDALGNVLKFILTPGQRNDITQAKNLIAGVSGTIIIADRAYDSDDFIETLKSQNCTPEIPPRKNRKFPRDYDQHLYKARHAIECFIGKIKHFRRISTRYDKSSQSFLAFLHFAGALIWLR